MTSAAAPARASVPVCAHAVLRRRLTDLFVRTLPAVTLISAPAAYGKTTLASQMACACSDALWFGTLNSCSSASEAILAAVDAVTRREASVEDRYLSLAPRPSARDALLLLLDALPRPDSAATCVVLDNLGPLPPSEVSLLLEVLSEVSSPHRFVVTLRSTRVPSACPTGVWVIGPKDLLLSDDEGRELAATILGDEDSARLAQELIECSGRQAGLLALLARRAVVDPQGWRRSVERHPDAAEMFLQLAIGQLDPQQMRVLYGMSLLGTGSLGDLSRVLELGVERGLLEPVALAVPLVELEPRGLEVGFRLHEIAQAALRMRASAAEWTVPLVGRAAACLAERGDHERALALVACAGTASQVVECLGDYGLAVLRRGGYRVIGDALSRLSPSHLVENHRLLVLKAAQELDVGDLVGAHRDARIGRELAEQGRDSESLVNAMLVLAQTSESQCDFLLAKAYIERAIDLSRDVADAQTARHLLGRGLVLGALFGDYARFREAQVSLASSRNPRVSASAEAVGRFFAATGDLILRGAWAQAWPTLESLSRSSALPLGMRISAAYNAYGCAVELGYLEQARRLLGVHDALTAATSNKGWESSSVALDAALRCAAGAVDGLAASVSMAGEAEWELGERLAALTSLLSASTGLLGARRVADAQLLLEQARRYVMELGLPLLDWQVGLETAAADYALGRSAAVGRTVADVLTACEGLPCDHILLRADLLLALVDMDAGRFEEATARIREHVEYILTESANWQLAMYVRAFPALLAPLCAAVGAADLPVHMLNLVLPAYAEEAFDASRAFLPQSELEVLSLRLRGRPLADAADPGAAPVCHVRVLGGLTVEVDGRIVSDKDWRKRKARLLFAMLCSRNGKDVPRDQLLDYLWPDMDQDQARNNLYVVWSSMKHALTPALGRGEDCPYVENRRGVCRTVPGRVVTDLEEFERKLEEATRARSEGDDAAELVALQRASELYRGDLLPGEAYDDWFATLRERCRHDYEDAMLRAATLQEQRGDVRGALGLLRRALVHDPWREDLYQAALRLQIVAGQRSAAIETYLTCRTRLVEDLGIDPSAETTRLYEQVLGMEDGLSDYMG